MADTQNPAEGPLGNGTPDDPIFSTSQLQALAEAGLDSADKVATASDEDLAKVPGVGNATIKKWREYVSARGMDVPGEHPPTILVDGGVPISSVVDSPGTSLEDMPGRVPENVTPNPDDPSRQPPDEDETEPPGRCPKCNGRTVPYLGPNPHKQDTSYCVRCDERFRARAVAVS